MKKRRASSGVFPRPAVLPSNRHSTRARLEEALATNKILVKQMVDLQENQRKLEQNHRNISISCAMQIAKLTAQLGVNIKSIDDLDTNILVSALVLKEVFGQLVQIDDMVKIIDPNVEQKLNEESIIERARAWYSDTVNDGFTRVRKEKEEHERQQRETAEAAAKARAAAQELANIAAEKKKIDEPAGLTQPVSEGPGSEHPEGAEFFGG
jgi:hypothetical protein